MDEMMRYIFRNMRETELSIQTIQKVLYHQAKLISLGNLAIAAFTLCLVTLEQKRIAQEKRIEALENKLKEKNPRKGVWNLDD